MTWQPYFGAWPEGQRTRFRVWAPKCRTVDVVLFRAGRAPQIEPLQSEKDGFFAGRVAGAPPGTLYKYRLDGGDAFPDPASQFQPEGVHGPSQVVDQTAFAWADGGWRGVAMRDLVVYELHVGTFTPGGTFAAAAEKLPYLADLGVTAVELMPVADFPGRRNWGYDGVELYAPARCYGTPDDLRRLVDRAHALGLAVLLDVVYNHFGPDGNYTNAYGQKFESQRHKSPWGASLNFDGAGSEHVRRFFIDNALYWLTFFHFDGLRLDATHAIVDDSERHFLAELTTTVREQARGRHVVLVAEDHRNLAHMCRPVAEGGWGLDGVWADDFHHENRRLLAGDCQGYYCDFAGTVADLAVTVDQGWFFTGQPSEHLGEPRGTDPTGLPPQCFVVCTQNHDQIGNRAFGDRLDRRADPAALRAAAAVLLCAPETPLLFMGQEWAASSPFLYFTDHTPELGRLVTGGRREEFRHFSEFSDPLIRETIPDPQADATFASSRLDWSEAGRPPHSGVLALYKALLRLRKAEPALRGADREGYAAAAIGDSTLTLLRRAAGGPPLLLVARLQGSGPVDLADAQPPALGWEVVLHTEDAAFTDDPQPPRVELLDGTPVIHFARPSAVLLRGRSS